MDNNYEEVLMYKAAWYYYFHNMTQQQISEFLGISRMRVVKLLNKARATGTIQFKMKDDSANRMQLEEKLTKAYDLKDTFIVSSPPSQVNTNENVARAAAMYINNRLEDNALINMGYGDTQSRILNNLAAIVEQPISIVSLTGGVNFYLPNNMSSIFNAKLYLIPSPILVSSKEVADAIKNESSINDISRMAQLSSLSVVGIGSMSENATTLKSGILSKNDLLYLKLKGAIGDVLCHFVDKDGKLVDSNIESRLITTSLDTLHRLKNVIGVAAGDEKVDAIKAVLNGGYIDILVTDESTALKLLENKSKSLDNLND
ncbi:sugar-binding transcriptional regulator [Clostridium saccharobutylicum]|uniref:Transcriptional regulator LsrR n=1 Tax=Clostridium saccharobutylicum DSM 13864 TaxID=1345695 RepID=U5MQN9_CLOSA|nr:sugar-binding transcriptional regulator [Clostridium saccharobutylicum]AGX43119.1 transcriptional regulator LsrR [Clostridium saccharobutylicum DSM 13864]AQR90416.1 transcriptional regulator LsrR [Clostridium saccharobutylicum]AQS00322.1 transcriptional regulator LsrR [Clostridium saccharobutylicum]AQS14305.1 transcriptional regulator LsrR [Clostridium saccharobutylicum]MBA2907014.1 DNA-binding transcriptional regulator LsrR (DeoR family) [Clostridium saccharobutylicum]